MSKLESRKSLWEKAFSGRRLKRQLGRSVALGWGIGREMGASVIASELYPLGIFGEAFPVVPPLRRPLADSPRPVLFLHGVFHNRSAFAWLKQRLAWGGVSVFGELNLRTSLHSIAEMADQVRLEVERLLKRHGSSQIDIVAHSLGGMVARYFVQRLGGDGVISHLVTVGTPHRGTPLSRYSLLANIRELSPDSALVTDLNRRTPPRYTQALAISGSLDVFTRPGRSGFWEGVRNVELSNLGHTGLLFSHRVARLVEARLISLARKKQA